MSRTRSFGAAPGGSTSSTSTGPATPGTGRRTWSPRSSSEWGSGHASKWPAALATLRAGAARAVIGTAALRDPALVGRLVGRLGAGRIAVALDVRDGLAVGGGWVPGAAGVPVTDARERLADAGARVFEVTAIDRDGTLGGPDLAMLGALVRRGRGELIASAGVASAADIRALRGLGCAGAIVGRALYEGTLTLEDALAEANRGAAPGD